MRDRGQLTVMAIRTFCGVSGWCKRGISPRRFFLATPVDSSKQMFSVLGDE